MKPLLWIFVFCTLAQAQDFPCKMTDYRVVNPSKLVLLCDGASALVSFSATGTLYLVQDESIVHPAVQQNFAGALEQTWWLVFQLTSPLKSGQDYELQFAGTFSQKEKNGSPVKPFKGARVRFSTKPVATYITLGTAIRGLHTHVALGPLGPDAEVKRKQQDGKYLPETKPASKEIADDYDTIGDIGFAKAPPSGSSLQLSGVTDVLQGAVQIDPSSHAPPISVPKSKSDANYYLNFTNQAGIGTTPTWIADLKLAPTLGGLHDGFFWAPSLLANVGTGSVGSTQATDTIDASLGVTRLIRNNGTFEGVRLTPSFDYETDRENDKRNALFDGEARFYFRGLSNTRAESQLDEFLRRKPTEKDLQLSDVKTNFGYNVQLFLGTEIGGALVNTTAKSSDKSSTVVVPTYSIFRLKPNIVTTLEYRAVTIAVTATPRYLFTHENVTRQVLLPVNGVAKEHIYLDQVSGFRPYGEVSINIALDPSGHYALGTTYKVGSQPPNFVHANLFQSGVTIRF